MNPRVSILSPDFEYVPAACTDVGRTFARIRREQRERAAEQQLDDAAAALILIRVPAANGAPGQERAPRHDATRCKVQLCENT